MSKSPTGAARRVAAGLLAGSLAVFGLALAPSAGATEDATLEEASGATRYGTAGAAASLAYPDGASCVIVASGEAPFDSLAAAGLAGAEGCPIVLTTQNDLTEETVAALGELDPETATIVGGTGRVSEDIEAELADMGMTVDREAGNDRFETARDIANRIGDSSTVIVASGEVAADALAVGAVASALSAPIVLVTTDDIPAASEEVLADADEVIIVGGTARISEANEAAIVEASNDDAADRLAGENRQETSIEIANYAVDTLGWAPDAVILAAPSAPSDPGFSPDALAAGPLGGVRQAPILIVTDADTLGPAEDFIDDHSNTIASVILVGGDAVLSPELGEAALEAAQNVGNDEEEEPEGNATVTDAPELVSAAFVTQSATSSTTVRFTFDEAVTGATPTPGSFHLYTNGMVTYNGTAAQVDGTNTSSVLVTFATTAEQFGQVTLATVDAGAVRDVTGAGGKNNPEGDAPMAAQSATAGATNAPDLVSVGNFRANATGDGVLVDYTFDEAAFTNGAVAAIYGLISAANTDLLGLANEVFGNGTVTHTVNFNGVNTTQLNTLTIARGYNTTNGIRDAANTLSPQEIAEANGTGNTSGPDLVSVTFNQDATNTIGGAIDQATYEFDEPVTVTDATDFYVYNVNGTVTTAAAASATRSTTNDRQVVVNYTDGVLASAVGAGVTDAAVNAATGDVTRTNQNDEVPVQGVSFAAGLTSGPDLIGARLVTETSNAFTGAVSTYSVVYTFDEAISATVVQANFKVYAGTAGAFGSALTGPFAVGGTNGCTVARSATNTSEAVMSGCTAAGASGLTPTNAFLNGGFVLAAVDVANVANGATQVAGNGAVSDGTLPNPEGSHPITQPAA